MYVFRNNKTSWDAWRQMGSFTISAEMFHATFHLVTKNGYNDENKKFY